MTQRGHTGTAIRAGDSAHLRGIYAALDHSPIAQTFFIERFGSGPACAQSYLWFFEDRGFDFLIRNEQIAPMSLAVKIGIGTT